MHYPEEFKNRVLAEFPDNKEWLIDKFKWGSIDIGPFLEKKVLKLDPDLVVKAIRENRVKELLEEAEQASRRNWLHIDWRSMYWTRKIKNKKFSC